MIDNVDSEQNIYIKHKAWFRLFPWLAWCFCLWVYITSHLKFQYSKRDRREKKREKNQYLGLDRDDTEFRAKRCVSKLKNEKKRKKKEEKIFFKPPVASFSLLIAFKNFLKVKSQKKIWFSFSQRVFCYTSERAISLYKFTLTV